VPGPRGRDWGASTIHGQRRRGNGILNNELYIGRIVWNRLRFIKDPETGKRVARFNPESAWITCDVPELRIVDQALWDKVKARQGAMEARISGGGVRTEDRRRPRYLFSGLLKCGVCGGGFVKYSHDRVACSTARTKGTCDNLLTAKRPFVEACVLNGLRDHLMDPALTEIVLSGVHAPPQPAALGAQRGGAGLPQRAREGDARSRPPRPGHPRRRARQPCEGPDGRTRSPQGP
jgi:site-specific DNA recombinase